MKKSKVTCLILVMFFMYLLINKKTYLAATSYDNAKEFYESTGTKGESYHADISNGMFYFGTKAKLASSSSSLKYYTIGYDITLQGNGRKLTFSVKRGGSMKLVSDVTNAGYNYLLYRIDTTTLYELATKSDPIAAEAVLESSIISVIANAVMTTKQGTTLKGDVTENGVGGLNEWGVIYHLKEDSQWKEMKRIFSGHEFKSYRNIEEELENYQLSIRYVTNGMESQNAEGSSISTVGNGYVQKDENINGTITKYVLYKDEIPVVSSARIVNMIQLISANTIELKKNGYHLQSGKEWIYNNQTFSSSKLYMPKEIVAEVGYGSRNIYMYANWLPNTYGIFYDANGGEGIVIDSYFSYDVSGRLRNNTYTRKGYHLKIGQEWNTKPDGSGISYSSGQVVKNLTSEDGKMIHLYANWEADVYRITANKQGGTNGTDCFFEKYAVDWYKENALQNIIKSITIPTKIGHTFLGYYENIYGLGTSIVDENGTINVNSDYFTRDSSIYAFYKEKEYMVTLNKMGGIGGSDSVVAIYGKFLPEAVAPLRKGFNFWGYYIDEMYQNDIYYSKHMASEKEYFIEGDSVLYAKWIDNIPPVVTIVAETQEWTNSVDGIDVTVSAMDFGTGLNSINIYRDNTLIKSITGLDGEKETTFTLKHTNEGVFRYKAIAIDMEGNEAEAYVNCKYDIKAPQKVTMNVTNETMEQLQNFNITVEVTDYNVR